METFLNKLFCKEIDAFLEILKNMFSSLPFQVISDIKIKLMMEEIKLHYLFLQYNNELFNNLVDIILEEKNYLKQKIESNKVYKRKPVKIFFPFYSNYFRLFC